MPKALLPVDLLSMNQTLAAGGVKALYAAMMARGFGYAHWAASVAYHLGTERNSSADYLRGPALMSIADSIHRVLHPRQSEKLRFDLAKAYLRILQRLMVAGDPAGIVRDIEVDELRELHAEGLERNGLSIENWNLHFPLVILERRAGADGPSVFWNYFRDSRRRPVHAALLANLAVLAFIYRQSESDDTKCRQMAGAWLSRNPMLYAGKEVDKKLRSAINALRAELPPGLRDFLTLLDLQEALGSVIKPKPDRHSPFVRRSFASAQAFEARESDDSVADQATAQIYEALIRRLTAP